MNEKTIQELCSIRTNSKVLAKTGLKEGKYRFYTSGVTHTCFVNEYKYDTRGVVVGRGGNLNIHFVDGRFSMSSDCCLLEAKSNEIDIKYLYYFLCAFPSSFLRYFKGTGLRHISIADIRKAKIKYPEISVQRSIVQVLSKVDNIISKRKDNITRFSEVLKNYYLLNLKNSEDWDSATIDDIKEDIKTGPFGSQLKKSQIKEEGDVYVLGIDNIKDNYFVRQSKRFISNNDLPRYKRYVISEGDVLISVMGTIGKSAVIPEGIGKAINTKHLVDITVDSNRCNPYFLSITLCNNPYVIDQLNRMKKGSIMPGVNMSDIKNLRIKLPDIKVQNYFEVLYKYFYNIIHKFESENRLLDELKKSLLNVYFVENKFPPVTLTKEISKEFYLDDDVSELLNVINSDKELNKIKDLSQYDELRSKLYEYLDEGNIVQKFNTKDNCITLKKS